jgi:hypothetical protein
VQQISFAQEFETTNNIQIMHWLIKKYTKNVHKNVDCDCVDVVVLSWAVVTRIVAIFILIFNKRIGRS